MRKSRISWFLFCGLFVLSLQSSIALTSIIVSPQVGFTNYDIFVISEIITQADGTIDGGNELISVTNDSEIVPVYLVTQTPVITISSFNVYVPPDVLSKTYTLIWTNYIYGTNYVSDLSVGAAAFILLPQSQSVFVSNTVTFAAQAVHTTGYQWQLDGTNLVENGHFIGVTNATLTISNVQFADAGDYSVIASNPDSSADTNNDAILNVFKPIHLGFAQIPGFGSRLLVANQDGSPFEANRIPNLQILSTEDIVNWNDVTVSGLLTNGVLQIDYPDDGSTNRFWRVLESAFP